MKALQAYQRAMEDSPASASSRMLELYDYAIQAAQAEAPEGVHLCLDILQNALDPTIAPNLVVQLHLFYSECHMAADAGEFDWLVQQLSDLRDLWMGRILMDQNPEDPREAPNQA